MDRVDQFYFNVRKNMRRIRREKNITQGELALMIGVSEGYISDIERNSLNKHPSIKCLLNISDALGVELVDLLSKEKKYEG